MSTNNDNTTGSSFMLRVQSKIAPVLERLVARRERIEVELPGNPDPFATHIVHTDPLGKFIIIAASADEQTNSALLALERVTLVSGPGDWHIEFTGTGPHQADHEGLAAIRLSYPEIVSVQQRRQTERHDPPAAPALRCLADAGGFAPFDARIRDISLGGVSALLHPPDVVLEPGTVLVGSRIEIPGADAITVDLEVRYSELLTQPDGSRVRCSGFRFLNVSDDVKQKLIDVMAKL
jgi:c-di-GMP-binding flagellar brake protein YcgR